MSYYTYYGKIQDSIFLKGKYYYLNPGSDTEIEDGLENEPYFKRLIANKVLAKNALHMSVEIIEDPPKTTTKTTPTPAPTSAAKSKEEE